MHNLSRILDHSYHRHSSQASSIIPHSIQVYPATAFSIYIYVLWRHGRHLSRPVVSTNLERAACVCYLDDLAYTLYLLAPYQAFDRLAVMQCLSTNRVWLKAYWKWILLPSAWEIYRKVWYLCVVLKFSLHHYLLDTNEFELWTAC